MFDQCSVALVFESRWSSSHRKYNVMLSRVGVVEGRLLDKLRSDRLSRLLSEMDSGLVMVESSWMLVGDILSWFLETQSVRVCFVDGSS